MQPPAGTATKHHRYRALLAGILGTFAIIIAVPAQLIGAPLRVAALGALLIGSVRTRRRSPRLTRAALVLAAVLFLATLVSAIFGSSQWLTVVSQSAGVILVVAAITILVRSLMAEGTVNGATVNGVLCVYLLLALFFGSLHELLGVIVPHYLNGTASPPNSTDTLYFSVITLTTVGFGDITPGTSIARAVASSEALVGQLYLVSVVATVVARYQPERLGG